MRTNIENYKRILNSKGILKALIHRISYFIPDKVYIKVVYFLQTGNKLNLKNPKSFNEKLQWLKLYDRKLIYTKMVDKFEAKKIVEDLIGSKYIIPTIGVWDRFEDIEFDILPNQFVLKSTHDSGGILICKNKSNFNIDEARKFFNKVLKQNFYLLTREWPYKFVKPRILAEKYMVDESGTELKDFKIFNFNGLAKIIQVDFDRFTEHKRNIYNKEWEFIDVQIQYPNDPTHKIGKPHQFEDMLRVAAVLSKNIPHLRTDFYSIGNQTYFGELTFHHGSGYEKFTPETFNDVLGNYIELPTIDNDK